MTRDKAGVFYSLGFVYLCNDSKRQERWINNFVFFAFFLVCWICSLCRFISSCFFYDLRCIFIIQKFQTTQIHPCSNLNLIQILKSKLKMINRISGETNIIVLNSSIHYQIAPHPRSKISPQSFNFKF
jgi:hypothetical protein